MNPPRPGMSCAGSVAVPTCPVMPILPPNPTRRSQGVQSLSPPGILALSWPQSKMKNSAVDVTTCAVSEIFLYIEWEHYQFGRCYHPGCVCISLPLPTLLPCCVWTKFGLSVQSCSYRIEGGKVRTQNVMNRNNLKWILAITVDENTVAFSCQN
jgi:hypothetical protein